MRTSAAVRQLSTLLVERIELKTFTPSVWDEFAARSGASMLSAYAHLSRLKLRMALRGRVETFGIFLKFPNGRRLIGHATVLSRRGRRKFYNGLNLAPEHSAAWPLAMEALLTELGPGVYDYGWALSLEPPRESELAAVPGVEIENIRPVEVHVVDFARWPSWDAYLRDVSENARRNARKAEAHYPKLQVVTRSGPQALGFAARLTRLRAGMYQRKAIAFRPWRVFAAYLANMFLNPFQTTISCAMAGGRVLAALRGARFGAVEYYLDGASPPDAQGAAWFLLLAMLRQAYRRDPRGHFVMGHVTYPLVRALPEGLMRQRRSVRADASRTSLLRFRWSGPAAAARTGEFQPQADAQRRAG